MLPIGIWLSRPNQIIPRPGIYTQTLSQLKLWNVQKDLTWWNNQTFLAAPIDQIIQMEEATAVGENIKINLRSRQLLWKNKTFIAQVLQK